MIKPSVNLTKWSSLLDAVALLFFIFRFEYLISRPKSYWDFRETGPEAGNLAVQGSKEVSSESLGQVDFLAEQLTFHAYLLIGLGSCEVILLTKSLESFRF